jgi:hypothetical protein
MAKQTINIGTTANDGTGDPLRSAFTKVNANFTELYDASANAITEIPNEFTYIELTDRHEPSGNIVTFVKEPNTEVSDDIDVGLSLTRKNNGGGLYNSAVESNFNRNVSPANTEWNWSGWDNLDNVKTRHYRTWTEALRKKVGAYIVGAELVMHDITNDKYYKVQFTQWNQGGVEGVNGSFAYTRELIDTSNQVGIIFEDGSNQIEASNALDWPVVWLDNNNYTIRLIDAKRILRGYDMTLFVPRDSDINFPIGTEIGIITENIGITVERVQHIEQVEAQIYGVGFGEARSSWFIPERSFARLLKIEENIWYLIIANSQTEGSNVLSTDAKTGAEPENVGDGPEREGATLLDLTKSVHKLSDGVFKIPDGQEGQIIHLVQQTGSDSTLIRVYVNKVRVFGIEYNDNYFEPFITNQNVITLIYTDDAWQSSGGQWD